MVREENCRLETACKCLDLKKPARAEWLTMSEEEVGGLSSLLGSLADPIRVRIVEMLTKDSLYVCVIQYLLEDIKYSRLSYHLDILRKEGIVESEREGNFLKYSLTPRGRSISRLLIDLRGR